MTEIIQFCQILSYGEIFAELFWCLISDLLKYLSCLRDMHGRLDKDHQVIIKENSSQLQELISTKYGGLLDELVQRKVITAAHKDNIMVSLSLFHILNHFYLYLTCIGYLDLFIYNLHYSHIQVRQKQPEH